MLIIKILFAIGALLAFTSSFAGSAAPEEAEASHTFRVGGEFLYVQPTTNALAYAQTYPLLNQARQYYNIKPGYTPSFRLFGNYYFTDRIDLGASWVHFRQGKGAITHAPGDKPCLAIPGHGDLGVYDFVEGSTVLKLDTINVEWGYTFQPNEARLTNRIHLGVQLLNLDNHINSKGTQETGESFDDVRVQSKFRGLGLRIGSNGEYDLDHGFSITAEVAASLLFGQNTWNETVISQTAFSPYDPVTTKSHQATRDIVPGLEGRIGIKYSMSSFALEGGYQIAGFINSTRDLAREYHHFGYQGPYLGARWQS